MSSLLYLEKRTFHPLDRPTTENCCLSNLQITQYKNKLFVCGNSNQLKGKKAIKSSQKCILIFMNLTISIESFYFGNVCVGKTKKISKLTFFPLPI